MKLLKLCACFMCIMFVFIALTTHKAFTETNLPLIKMDVNAISNAIPLVFPSKAGWYRELELPDQKWFDLHLYADGKLQTIQAEEKMEISSQDGCEEATYERVILLPFEFYKQTYKIKWQSPLTNYSIMIPTNSRILRLTYKTAYFRSSNNNEIGVQPIELNVGLMNVALVSSRSL